jgi:hypothetical protein
MDDAFNYTFINAGGNPSALNTSVVAGKDVDGSKLFPCIAQVGSQQIVGKTRAGWGTCDIDLNGRETWIANYTTLTPGIVPSFTPHLVALGAGTDFGGGELGICTTPYDHSIQVGRYVVASNTCSIGFGGAQIPVQFFGVVGH